MSKEKHIEKMLKYICMDCRYFTRCNDDTMCNDRKLSEALKEGCSTWKIGEVIYNASYRKQSEGEWIEHSEIGAMNNFWECSVCHWETVSFTEMKHSKYCPNCGAKMKGGAE